MSIDASTVESVYAWAFLGAIKQVLSGRMTAVALRFMSNFF
jgi:hypothetical protein